MKTDLFKEQIKNGHLGHVYMYKRCVKNEKRKYLTYSNVNGTEEKIELKKVNNIGTWKAK